MTNEKNINFRKRLFEIISKFMVEKQKNTDVKELAEIFIYHAPYKNRVVYKTSKDDLKIDFKKFIDDDGSYENKVITFDKKTYRKNFFDILITLGHEYTHYIQDLVNKAVKEHKIAKIRERVQKIIYSLELPNSGGGIYNFLKTYKYLNLALKPKEVESIAYALYLQLPDEENARKCSFQFVKEILHSLKEDELCPKNVREYLTLQETLLKCKWKKELKNYDKNYYVLRRVYEKAIRDTEYVPYKEIIAKSKDPKLQEELICGKMLNYRKQGMEKKEYFKHLFNSCGLFYSPNEYEDIKKDLKNLTIEYLTNDKDVDISHIILLLEYIKVNNKYYKDNKFDFVEMSDFPEICTKLLKNGNSKTVYAFVEGIFNIAISKKDKNDPIQKTLRKNLTKKQCGDIYWDLVQNDDLCNAIFTERERLVAKQQEDQNLQDEKASNPIEKAEMLIKQTKDLIDNVNLDLLVKLDDYISCGKQALANTQYKKQNKENEIEG